MATRRGGPIIVGGGRHKSVDTSGGTSLGGGRHKSVDTSGGLTGVKRRAPRTSTTSLPEWWGVLLGQDGPGNFTTIYQPLSNAIAPDQLLPVCYGAVRIGGTVLNTYSPFSSDITSGAYVIAWCEGPIYSVDTFYCDGQPVTEYKIPTDGSYVSRSFAHYGGTDSDPSGGHFPTAPNVALTDLQIWKSDGGWWNLLPNGAQDAVHEWAADLRGLWLWDPRIADHIYSDNPALIVRDLLTRFGRLTSGDLDDVSFAAAADTCDDQGFTCSVAFATKTILRDALSIVLQTCNGQIITANGKTGIVLDVPQPGPVVATFLEEDGDLWDLKYEWMSARDRYTRVAVSFNNKDANYKPDQTPDFDDPGVTLGIVPVKATVINAPGINTLAAAIILRDYLFNSQAVNFRVSGTMSAKGLGRQQGEKIHLVTLKGIVGDYLIVQISGDQQGFFQFVAKPYDSAVYGTIPITQQPPVVTGPPNPMDPGEDIIVTDTSTTRQAIASSGSNQTVYNLWQLIKYQLPTTGPALKQLVARGFAGSGALSKTWDDMAGTEFIIPLTGNEPQPDATHYMLSHPGVVKGTKTLDFDMTGQLIQTVTHVGPTRIIIKTSTYASALSTGVTIDVSESTNTDTNPRTDVPLWKWVKSSTPANGSTKVFAVPTKPVASTLMVVADGQVLVDTSFSPAEGADYSLSGLNVTIASGRGAPLSYVAFMYQESVEE